MLRRMVCMILFVLIVLSAVVFSKARIMECLDRGFITVKVTDENLNEYMFLSWRKFGTDPQNIKFNLYRDGSLLVKNLEKTNYFDSTGTTQNVYEIRTVIDGIEQNEEVIAKVWNKIYYEIPLNIPEGGKTPDGVSYTYNANDASVGDLDGDGEYEIVLKWDPSNSKDNSKSGYTGNTIIDAYDMDGTHLWRIDLGKNIRSGAHYTPFIVYDLDSDGKAELAVRTSDGAVDGQGNVIGDPDADYRNSFGYVLTGPEYLTIFDGETGEAITSVDYEPARGNVKDWGDDYGNRCDRFLMTVAYLDGVHPSLITCRGYYGPRTGFGVKNMVAAWNFSKGELKLAWIFEAYIKLDANGNISEFKNVEYIGQGAHWTTAADVDNDGKDEIVYGACVIDDNGEGLYSTGLGHGDALHVSDMDPDRPGLEIFMPHESGGNGVTLRDAATGDLIFQYRIDADVGRGCAGDIRPDYRGFELWASNGCPLFTCKGENIGKSPGAINFVIYWDGDLKTELLDNLVVSQEYPSYKPLLYAYGCASNNGTKATPCLSADIIGDWREEVIFRKGDNSTLRIYTTTIPTEHSIYTLMHDPVYRIAVASQNVGYNQPPHPGFYLGEGMNEPPLPNIVYPSLNSIDEKADNNLFLPLGHKLLPSYPNPFNSSTFINFVISKESKIKLQIYDINGREVVTLSNSRFAPGQYTLRWDGKDKVGANVPSGVYFVVLRDGVYKVSEKIVLIR